MSEQSDRDDKRYYGPGGSVPWMKLDRALSVIDQPKKIEKNQSLLSEAAIALRGLKREIIGIIRQGQSDHDTR